MKFVYTYKLGQNANFEQAEKVIKAYRADEEIKVSFPYNRNYIARIKTIEGHKWHPERRYWSVPYSDNVTEVIVNGDVKNYLFSLAEQRKVSTSTLNTAINALKFYYGDVLKREFVCEMKRPKKDKKLPVVLNQEEVSRILSSVNNIKHKLILMLIYSAGLRVSEVVKLRPENVDTQRKLVVSA